MKVPTLLCGAFLSVFAVHAAEPWVCTVPGTRLEYTLSVRGLPLGEAVKTVASFDGAEVLLQAGDDGVAERWAVYPDSTVLRMEAPPELCAMLEQPCICNGSLSLPSRMQAGDKLRDLRLLLSGVAEKDPLGYRDGSGIGENCQTKITVTYL